MAIALDTLVYAGRLREAGFSEQQAEALAAAMTESFATKQDLRALRVTIEASLRELQWSIRVQEQDAHMQKALADFERRLTLRLGGIIVAGIGTTAVLVKVL